MSTSAIAALESELESPLRSFLDSNSAIRAPHPSSSARAAPNVPSFIYDAFFLALRPNASATDAGCESYKFGAYSFCNVDVSGFYFIVMGRFGLSVALFGLAANILAFPVCFVTGIRSAASQLLAAILLCDTVTAALGVLLYCTVRFFPGTSEQLAVYQSFTVFIFPFGQPLIECAEMASIYLLVLLLFERHRYLRSGSFLRGGGCAPRNVLYAGLMVSAFSLLYSLPKFIEFQVVSDARSSTESAFLTGPYAVRTQFGNNTLYQKVYHSLLRVPIEMFIPYIAIVCFSCMLAFLICKYRMYTHLFPAYAYACLAPRAEGADAALANNVASEAEMPASPGNGHDEQPAGQPAGDGLADGPRWQKRGGDHLNLALSPAEITMKHLEQSYFALLATSMSVDADSHSDLKTRDAEGMSGNGGGGAFAAAADSAYAAAQREAEVGGAADLATDMSMRTWIAIALYKEHLDTILVCAIAALALVCKVPQLAFRMLLGESDRFEMYAQGTGDSRNINDTIFVFRFAALVEFGRLLNAAMKSLVVILFARHFRQAASHIYLTSIWLLLRGLPRALRPLAASSASPAPAPVPASSSAATTTQQQQQQQQRQFLQPPAQPELALARFDAAHETVAFSRDYQPAASECATTATS